MTFSERSGADLTDAAVFTCGNGASVALSGAGTLPGNAHDAEGPKRRPRRSASSRVAPSPARVEAGSRGVVASPARVEAGSRRVLGARRGSLAGGQHGKRVGIRVLGSEGTLTYEGDDQAPASGALGAYGKTIRTRRDGREG